MSMPRWTLLIALVLIALGIAAYFGTGQQSVTALIPSFLGLPMLLLGLWGQKESARKTAMHIAAVLALVGLGGTASGLVKVARLAGGAALERPQAAIAQAIVAVVCLFYLVLAVRSFIRARGTAQSTT